MRLPRLMLTILFYLSAVNAAASPLATLTEAEQVWLRENAAKIELCYCHEDCQPFEFNNKNGIFSGLSADVISLVESRLGVTFPKKHYRNWSQHMAALEEGGCTVAPAVIQTAERETFSLFTTPYLQNPMVIVGTDRLGYHLSLDDLSGLRVAVGIGYASEVYVRQQAGGRFEIIGVNDVEEGLKTVAFGQVDAYIGDIAVISHYVGVNGITNLHVAGKTGYMADIRFAVNRRCPELHAVIQKALDDITPAELKTVHDRWITLHDPAGLSPETVRMLITIGSFLGLLILFLAIITFFLKRRLNEKVVKLTEAQEATARSEARFRALFFHAPLPLAEVTKQGETMNLNESFERTLGYSLGDLPSIEDWWPLAYPDPAYREQVKTEWNQKMAEAAAGNIKPSEYRIRCGGGESRVFLVGAGIAGDRVVVSLVDIDERKQMENKVAASRENFAALFEMAPFSCVINDFKGRYLMVNRHFCERTGRPPEQIIGRTMKEIGREADPAEMNGIIEEIRKTGSCLLREIVVRNGKEKIYCLFASRRIEWEGRQVILTATINITDRKQMEQALRLTQYSVDNSRSALVWIKRSGQFSIVNRAYCDYLGYSRKEILSMKVWEVDALWPPEKWSRNWPRWKNASSPDIFKSRLRRKDGTVFPVEISVSYVSFEEREFIFGP